ncbi:MAG TPA: hypothetical protein VF941_13665 [Clostridia bacterium]
MLIKSYTKEYLVKTMVMTSDKNDIYICKETNSKSQNLFTVNVIKDSFLISKYLPIFIALNEKNMINDLIDVFIEGSYLYIVLNYFHHESLFIQGFSIISLEEKIKLSESLLTYVRSSGFPIEVSSLYFDKENITFDDSCNIYFNYFFNFGDFRNTPKASDLIRRTGIILKETIFQSDLMGNHKLQEIIKNCEEHYKSIDDLEHDFYLLKESLYTDDLSAEKHKKDIGYIKAAGYVSMLVCLILLLVVLKITVFKPVYKPGSYKGLYKIGSIELSPNTNNNSDK